MEAWNTWRSAHRDIRPDLVRAQLVGAALDRADLTWADLTGVALTGAFLDRARLFGAHLAQANLAHAALTEAQLVGADFTGADLVQANLAHADLTEAQLVGADLTGANLFRANLLQANLAGASLSRADLQGASLVATNFEGANLTGCQVYGLAAWNVNLTEAHQTDLVITPDNEPVITVDHLEVAQFIYLLLHNEKIREVIDTITSKAVLILGRFTPKRKAMLDALREELRRQNYLPIVFDFEKSASRDLTETISTLAHLARFIIADLTDAKSIPQELQRIVPALPSVPVQPLLQASAKEYSMFEHFKRFPWVLPLYRYKSTKTVITSLKKKIIVPAELKAKELLPPKRKRGPKQVAYNPRDPGL